LKLVAKEISHLGFIWLRLLSVSGQAKLFLCCQIYRCLNNYLVTAILLIGRDDWLPLNWGTRIIEKVGDWSYSLYLIHWPLFAFANNAYLGVVPHSVMWFLCFLSLALAFIQYKFVEEPFRYGWKENNNRTIRKFAVSSAFVIFLPIPAVLDEFTENKIDAVNFQSIRRPNVGLSWDCAQGKTFIEPLASCMTSETPVVALWGDSYVMHLAPGIKRVPALGNSLVQITKAACAPIKGIASIDSNYDEIWAQTCLDFNEQAFKYIQDHKSIKYVILSSPFSGYFDTGKLKLYFNGKEIAGERELAIDLMVKTIKGLQHSGKYPIIISPPPKSGFNIGECLERKAENVLVLGRSDCNFKVTDYQLYQQGIIDALKEIEQRTGVEGNRSQPLAKAQTNPVDLAHAT